MYFFLLQAAFSIYRNYKTAAFLFLPLRKTPVKTPKKTPKDEKTIPVHDLMS